MAAARAVYPEGVRGSKKVLLMSLEVPLTGYPGMGQCL